VRPGSVEGGLIPDGPVAAGLVEAGLVEGGLAQRSGSQGAAPVPDRLPAAPPESGWAGHAVVDIEATGPDPRRHRVVEVAVVLLDRDCATEGEFTTLLDPGVPMARTRIHGIAEGDVDGAPCFADIAPYLLTLLSGRTLVAHHANCDRGFLVEEYARLGVAFPDVPTLCTMRLAAEHLPALAAPSLRACCAAAGLPPHEEHTALGDARATAELLSRYVERAPRAAGAWNQALLEAARLEWPGMAWRGVPTARHRGDAAGQEPGVRGRQKVPLAGNGGA
jgi:DNA polymerase III subunit epsilon